MEIWLILIYFILQLVLSSFQVFNEILHYYLEPLFQEADINAAEFSNARSFNERIKSKNMFTC